MIFTAAGTQDGRAVVRRLCEAGYDVTASVVSSYGEQLLEAQNAAGGHLTVHDTPLDADEMAAYFRTHDVRVFVDATHPYAVNVSRNAMAACAAADVPYIRYERDLSDISYEKVHLVHSYEEAAETAAGLGRHIFLTTGSRNLARFVHAAAAFDCVLTARVLPTAEVVALCTELGLTPAQEDLGLPVVVIDRPVLSYPHLAHTAEEVLTFVADIYDRK